MSPDEIKALRVRLGLTQKNLALALGVNKLTLSQYETGFRKPGPTALVVLFVLDRLPKKKALELVALLQGAAKSAGLERESSDS